MPNIPPMVARLLVEVSGPNIRPNGAAAPLSWSCTTPTSTRAVRASGSSSMIRFRCREQSSTMPGPIGLPGQAGARAARGDHDAEPVGHPDGRRDVVGVPGEDHAHRHDRVHAGVAGEEVAAVVVELHLALELRAQQALRLARELAGGDRGGKVGGELMAWTGPAARRPPRCPSTGTPALCRPICTPHSVPASIRSLNAAEVADPEDLAGELGQPGAQRHVVALEDDRAAARRRRARPASGPR